MPKIRAKTKAITGAIKSDVVSIRHHLGLSQSAFAAFMGVSVSTLRNWEQGRRQPQGAARSLLLVAEKVPHALRQIFDLAQGTMET